MQIVVTHLLCFVTGTFLGVLLMGLMAAARCGDCREKKENDQFKMILRNDEKLS